METLRETRKMDEDSQEEKEGKTFMEALRYTRKKCNKNTKKMKEKSSS